jgi:hypothetical protein
MSLACYVLYLEHDNRPHKVWALATREEAELLAVSIAQDVWIDCEGGEDEEELPSGEQLLEILSINNEHLRLYRCIEDDESEELTLRCFETPHEEEAA